MTIEARDAQGNAAVATVNFVLDTTRPTAALERSRFVRRRPRRPWTWSTASRSREAAFELASYQLTMTSVRTRARSYPWSLSSSWVTRSLRIDLAEPLASLQYQLAVSTAIADLAGNALGAPTRLPLSVVEPVGITRFSPYDGEHMVNVAREVTVYFDGEIDPATVNDETFYVVANGERLDGTIRVSSTREFMTFFPDRPWPASTGVRVVVDGNRILNPAGIPVDADGDGVAGGIGIADFATSPLTTIEGTSISGYVLDAHRTVDPGIAADRRSQRRPLLRSHRHWCATIPFTRAKFVGSTGSDASNPRQHVNLITSFLDASMVYGSDEARAEQLRRLDGSGRLKVGSGDLLPLNDADNFPDGPLEVDNQGPFDDSTMFVAGDIRATENPGLSALHTLLVREHNRYVDRGKVA